MRGGRKGEEEEDFGREKSDAEKSEVARARGPAARTAADYVT